MSKAERSEERGDLLEKWKHRLSAVFLEMGLDFQEFWRRWEEYDHEHPRESRVDLKLMHEMVTMMMYKACFDSRLESLDALADAE